jgi:hypothetical protein
MVWGMALPGNFGAFFPNGEYVGWRDELNRYFKNEMPAEHKSLFIQNGRFYPSYVMSKFAEDPGKQMPDHPAYTPIELHEAPKKFVLQEKYTSLGSLIHTEDGILAIDEPLRDIIERFEPGVHQFFPLEIDVPFRENYEKHFKKYSKQFFVFVIRQYIDSFLPDQSDSSAWKKPGKVSIRYKNDKTSMSGLAFSKQIFGNAHLWRERRMESLLVCFSDILMSEIRKARLRLPNPYRLKEI